MCLTVENNKMAAIKMC